MSLAQRVKRFLFILPILIVVLIAVFFASLPFWLRPILLERLIIQSIVEKTAYVPAFGAYRLSLFPVPTLELGSFSLRDGTNGEGEIPLLEASQARFQPAILPLAMGRVELAHVGLENAQVHYPWKGSEDSRVRYLSLRNLSLDLWDLREAKPVRFKARGSFLSDAENVELKGFFETGFHDFNAERLRFEAETSIEGIEVAKLAEWWGGLPFQVHGGTFSFSGSSKKESGATQFSTWGAFDLAKFVYELPGGAFKSTASEYQGSFRTRFDLASQKLILEEASLTAPFGGPFRVEAALDLEQAQLESLFIQSETIRLEELPIYILPFSDALPVHSGFSGSAGLDLYAKGNADDLSFNLNLDLTGTNLTYSKFFSKPSGVTLTLRNHLKLTDRKRLAGDFTVAFENATLKGSLVQFDWETGAGEVTFLTNKFDVDQWEQYFPLIRSFELSGAVKVLSSAKGNFKTLESAQVMHNVTLDQVGAAAANGVVIKGLSGSVDLSPVVSEMKNLAFEFGNSAFTVQGKMFHKPELRGLVSIKSAKLDHVDFLSQLGKMREPLGIATTEGAWDFIESLTGRLLRNEESLEQVYLQAAFGRKKVQIPQLKFSVYGGQVDAQSVFDFSAASPEVAVDVEVSDIQLARAQRGDEKLVEGNLFAVARLRNKGPWDDAWLNRLTGTGSVSVTNGEFHTLDMLRGASGVSALALLKKFATGTTRFNDLRGDVAIGERMLKTENMALVSDDVQIKAAGGLYFDGQLNFRLSAFLSPELSRRIIPKLGEAAWIGPIPLLLVGTASKPSIKQDPMFIQTFLDHLSQGRLAKALAPLVSVPTPQLGQKAAEETAGDKAAKSADEQGQEEKKKLYEKLSDRGFSLLEELMTAR